MKKIIAALLIGIMAFTPTFATETKYSPAPQGMTPEYVGVKKVGEVFVLQTKLPSFYTTKGSIMTRDASTGWKDYQLQSVTKIKSNENLGNHPSFPSLLPKQASQILLSSDQRESLSVSLGYGAISVSYAPGPTGSMVFPNKFYNTCTSKVVIIGNVYSYNYLVKEYNGAGTLIRTFNTSVLSASDTFPGFVGMESPYMNVLRY